MWVYWVIYRDLLGSRFPTEATSSDPPAAVWPQIWLTSSHVLASGFQGTRCQWTHFQWHPFPQLESCSNGCVVPAFNHLETSSVWRPELVPGEVTSGPRHLVGKGRGGEAFSFLLPHPLLISSPAIFVPKTKHRVLKHIYNWNVLFLSVSVLFLILLVLDILKLWGVFDRRLLRWVSNGEESFGR